MFAQRVSTVVGYGGSGTAIAFGLSVSEWQAIGVIGGLVLSALGFAFGAWLGWRRDQREERQRRQQCE